MLHCLGDVQFTSACVINRQSQGNELMCRINAISGKAELGLMSGGNANASCFVRRLQLEPTSLPYNQGGLTFMPIKLLHAIPIESWGACVGRIDARDGDVDTAWISPAITDAALHLSAVWSLQRLAPNTTFIPVELKVYVCNGKEKSENSGFWVPSRIRHDAKDASRGTTTDAWLIGGHLEPAIVFDGLKSANIMAKPLSSRTNEAAASPVNSNSTTSCPTYHAIWQAQEPTHYDVLMDKGVLDGMFGRTMDGLQIHLSNPLNLVLASAGILQALQAGPFASWLLPAYTSNNRCCEKQYDVASAAAHGLIKVAASERAVLEPNVIMAGVTHPGREVAVPADDAPSSFGSYEDHRVAHRPILFAFDTPVSPPSASADLSQCIGVPVVTGAFGGLGSLVSSWLSTAGITEMLLLGRNCQQPHLVALTNQSTLEVACIQTDVACMEDDTAVGWHPKNCAKISIFHAGGVLRDASLSKQTLGGLRTVHGPKTSGMRTLHNVVGSQPLQNLTMFSSIAGILGSAGQANYASANAALDTMAAGAACQGHPGCSIQWGAWSDVGMTSENSQVLKRLVALGYGLIGPAMGLRVLYGIVTRGAGPKPAVLASPMDWPVFLRRVAPANMCFYRYHLPEAEKPCANLTMQSSATEGYRTKEGYQRTMVLQRLSSMLATVVSASSAGENVPPDAPLMEAGLDSIGAVELRNLISEGFGLSLPATVVFEHPTIKALSEFIMSSQPEVEGPSTGAAFPSKEIRTRVHQDKVEILLLSIIQGVSGVHVDVNTPLVEAGIDSIAAVELRQAISERWSVDLPVTAIYDYPTISVLAAYLATTANGAGTSSHERSHSASMITLQSSMPLEHESVYIMDTAASFPSSTAGQGSSSVGSVWAALQAGTDAAHLIPYSRWDINSVFNPDSTAGSSSGSVTYTRFAAMFAEAEIAAFDAEYFRVPSAEAVYMDPHIRAMLHHVREVIPSNVLDGSKGVLPANVGTYVGCMWVSEFVELLSASRINSSNASVITGNTFPFMTGRVPYVFGWHGPAVGMDTACSSSLVAAHTARSAVLSNECTSAVVSGVNLMLSITTTLKISALQALSPDGRCKSFAATADGYGRGEGFVVAWLEKHVSDYQIQSKGICARLCSSTVNSAGKSSGITAPHGPAQRTLVTQALTAGGIMASDISAVAVHGTGTVLGDPIETGALAQALHEAAPALLSVKSCFGHTEGAAGLTGALLAIGVLQNWSLSPIAGLRVLNPYVASTLSSWRSSVKVPRQYSGSGNAAQYTCTFLLAVLVCV